jgi:hypothetical protein
VSESLNYVPLDTESVRRFEYVAAVGPMSLRKDDLSRIVQHLATMCLDWTPDDGLPVVEWE